ncbi:hypothetical protein MN116_000758 [Schistosoma mekongi]|uniref:BAH domain-containing protein n=1 Tax=Schistosoma mekongi TaxID=38744 RepID=A0AAE1ZJL3_SCHME|nr:hypothetical protein MN116_000758 [Schistosoma mekongi]
MPLTSGESLSLINLELKQKSPNLCVSVDIPSSPKESIKISPCSISPTFNIADILSTHYEGGEVDKHSDTKQSLKSNESCKNIQMMNATQMNTLVDNNDFLTKSPLSMGLQCISEAEIKPSLGWSNKTCDSHLDSSHSFHCLNLDQETIQCKMTNLRNDILHNDAVSTAFSQSELKNALTSIDSCISNELSHTLNLTTTDNSSNNDDICPLSISNKRKTSFASIGVQTEDQLYSPYCNKEMPINDNFPNISYITDSSTTISTINSNNNNNNIESLIDAIKFVYAEIKIEQAEVIINDLIEKFAEPLDMYTSVENLPKDNSLFYTVDNNSNNNNNNNNNNNSVLNEKPSSTSPSSKSSSFFSPIFKLLLTQSESQIFPDLYKLSPSGRKLYDLCHRLAFDIRRTKNKLRILQKMRTKQSNLHNNISITSATPSTIITTTTITPSTMNNVSCMLEKRLNVSKLDSLNYSLQTSQHNRRNAFINYLHDICKNNYEVPKSETLASITTITSNHVDENIDHRFQHGCKSSQLFPHPSPSYYYGPNKNNNHFADKYEKYLENLLLTLRSLKSNSTIHTTNNDTSQCIPISAPPTYTNPLNCPLSLLSFVSNLNKAKKIEQINDDSIEEEGGESKTNKRHLHRRQCRQQRRHLHHQRRKHLQVKEKSQQNKHQCSPLADSNSINNNTNATTSNNKRDYKKTTFPFSSSVLSSSSPSPSSSSLSTVNMKSDLMTTSVGNNLSKSHMLNASTIPTSNLTITSTTDSPVINGMPLSESLSLSTYSVSQSNDSPPPPYPFYQHHIELSCSLNMSSLSPSITPSLCFANSHGRTTTLHSNGHCYHQDQNHRGKRRQFSSPLEEHNRLNNENDFTQTPSKSRRCSSFNSQKCLINKSSTTQQLHNSAASVTKTPTKTTLTTPSPTLCCCSSSSSNITSHQPSIIDVRVHKLINESDQHTVGAEHHSGLFIDKTIGDVSKSSSFTLLSSSPSSYASFASSSSPSSSSAVTIDSSINPSTTRLSDTLWSSSKLTDMHNNITDTDKLKQLSIDVRDSRYEDNDENQREVNLFIVPTVLSPYSPVQLTPPCSPNLSSSTSLSPPSTITFPQNGCISYRNQQQQAVSCYSRDDFSGGWISNRPPTPDIRRSELDLADLSDGTRVLVIQDTYLRAGTLYLGKDSSSPPTSQISLTSNDCLRDQVFRIKLDTEKLTSLNNNSRITNRNRLTSLASSSSSCNHANNNSTRRSSCCLQSPSSSLSSLNNTGNNCRLFTSKNRRRQLDLLLYGWQVVQQAVLEVFPASIRHVPPGTRVCAAWSEQLGVNLYPGTVAKADSDEQHINNDCVPVDFDDGDHRQVPITDLRILPDYFTNLCELIAITGESNINNLTPCFFSSNLNLNGNSNDKNGSEKHGRITSRIRRHSDVDHTAPVSYHSWSQSTSPFIQETMSSSLSQISTNFAVNSRSSLSVKTSAKSSRRVKGNRSRKNSQLSSSSSNKTTEWTISSLTSPTYTSTAATSVMSTRSLSPPASVQQLERVIDVNNHTFDGNYIMGCSNNDNNSEKIIPSKNYLSEEFMMDYISIASTITTTNSSEECLSWQVFEKFKRRKQGCIYCRSIIRDVDGLIVKVGDCVQFGSGRDEIYLGEVKEIRWEHKKNSLIVVAAWYYQPLEAGKDGELVQDIKGALFTTEHKDENEAKCIKRRIKVAKTYGQFIQGYYDKPKGKESLNLSRSLIHKDEKFSSKKDSEQIRSEPSEPPSEIHSIMEYPSVSRDSVESSQSPKLQIMLNNNEISSDDDDDHFDNNSNFYHYFIAGKYDPVKQQVIAWDTELAKTFNLKTHKSR